MGKIDRAHAATTKLAFHLIWSNLLVRRVVHFHAGIFT